MYIYHKLLRQKARHYLYHPLDALTMKNFALFVAVVSLLLYHCGKKNATR